MKYIFIISTLLISLTSFAQQGEVGDWIDYSPYKDVFKIATSPDRVYGATPQGLIEYNVSDNSTYKFSKVLGLSDVGITSLGYNQSANTFVIGYRNGKIDLIQDDNIWTITDLNRKTISGDKSLNNIHMDSVFAYIATGFGVVKFNVLRREFTETYLVTTNGENIFVNDVTISNDTIYAATVQGIRKAWINDPELTFYESWSPETTLPNPLANFSAISSYDTLLYAVQPHDTTADTLFFKTPNSPWVKVEGLTENKITSVEAYGTNTLISHILHVSNYNDEFVETERIFNYGEGINVTSNYAMQNSNGTIWVGDKNRGMIENPAPFQFNIIDPESPAGQGVDEIAIRNNEIWVAAGLKQNNWTNNFSNAGVYWRSPDLNWEDINKFENPDMFELFDFVTIEISPQNSNLIYAGALRGGLLEITDKQVTTIYDTTNSSLQNRASGDYVSITGLTYDGQGNLWVANGNNPKPISVLTPTGEWYNYSFGNLVSDDQTGDIIVDNNNFKWLVLPKGGKGILVFNDNGTLDNEADDESKILNNGTGTGGLPSSDVYSLAKDQSGSIWVGTSEGVAVFYSPGSVFTPGAFYDAQQIIVEVNGYFQYLLGTETVTAVAVDGANRKWFGTRGSGVFLMSADGTEQLHNFTAENSPLLSNFIRTISINETTGEVLFGTDDGMIAYKGTATGAEPMTNPTYAYPNPVPENYEGNIAIKGLPANSFVRITDITGNLVFDTQSEGTQAIWNGKDMNGNRVATGIYLVFGTDSEGSEHKVAKILFTK